MNIKHGIGTKVLAAASTLALVPPLIVQIVADVENVTHHWSTGEQVALVTGAGTAIALAGTKAVQAGIAIWRGAKDV